MEVTEAPVLVENVFFRKIGADVPVAKLGSDSFWKEVPARGLAVSNTYGYTFFAHPDGFAVARTADLCQLAQKLKEHFEVDSTAKKKALQTVDVSDVRSLVLSADELAVAVITGDRVHVYDVPDLIHESNSNPFETISTGSDKSCVRDFCWSPSSAEAYIMLSTEGTLIIGSVGKSTRVIEEGVLAACWSPDGHHIAYGTRDANLSITDTGLAEKLKFVIPQLSEPDHDETIQVDTVQWVRPDSIMLGCVSTTPDEDDFRLLMIGCNRGDLAEENTSRIGFTFGLVFLSLESEILPTNSGPYMLVEYLSPWHMAVATSRRSVDDHIVLLAWRSEEGQYSPYVIEIGNDAWIPRIQLSENQNDNIVVGMAIDRTSEQVRVSDPKDETGTTMLPACPVLLCLTLEGKLSLFSFARCGQPTAVTPSLDLPIRSRIAIEIAREPSIEITADAAAPALDVSHGIDDVTTEDESSSVKSDVAELGDQEVDSGEHQYAFRSYAQGGLGFVGSGSQKVSGRSDDEPEHLEAGKHISSKLLPTSSTQEVVDGDLPQKTKLAGELTASKSSSLLPQGTALYERFTKVVPQPDSVRTSPPDSVRTSPHVSEAWDVGRLSSVNLFGQRPAWGNVGAKGQQPAKAEKPAASVASTLEGMYRPYSSGSSSSQLVQQVEKPQSTLSIKEKVPPVSSSIKMPAVSFSQPSSPAIAVTAFSSLTSEVNDVSANTIKLDQKNTKSPILQRNYKEQKPEDKTTGVSNVEAAFTMELEKVRKMAAQLDKLMSSFQSFIVKGNGQSLEDLEEGVSRLSEDVKRSKKSVIKQQQAVEDLLDDGIRVDAWRVYTQSVAEQSADVRYKDLWVQQKLHPQLESRRKSVVEADQLLKQQIADLERHLHSLEFNHRQQMKDAARKKTSTSMRSQGQFQALQNLYNTVNSQREVAEHLADRLSLQMKALNISSTSASSSQKAVQPAAAGILRSLGLSLQDEKDLQNEGLFQSPLAKKWSSYQDSAEFALLTPSWQQSPHEAESGQSDMTRRRRDSMDMAWVGAGAAKTTIKRTARVEPMQSLSTTQQDAVKSQLRTFRKTPHNIRHDTVQVQHVNGSLAASFNHSQQKHVNAVGPTLSPEDSDEQQVGRGKLPPVDTENGTLLFPASMPGRQMGNSAQSKDGLFKWVNTDSSQATTASSGNGASFRFSPSSAPNSPAGIGFTGTKIGTGLGAGNVPQHVAGTASSEHGLPTGIAKAEPKPPTASSYRPGLSRKLDLDPDAKSKFPLDVHSQFRSSEFDEEERQQSPRDSKMAKTRDSGMNGGFGSMRDRLTAFGNAGGQTSMFSVNSSLSPLAEPSPQPLTSQSVPESASRSSAAQVPSRDDSVGTVPAPTKSATTGKDGAITVGGIFAGNQLLETSLPPAPQSPPSRLDPPQPAAFAAHPSVSGNKPFPPASTASVAGQLSFPKPAQPLAPVVPGVPVLAVGPEVPVVPVDTNTAAPIATSNLTTTAETSSPFLSAPPPAVGFGSPPSVSEPLATPQVCGGFPASFPAFGASGLPSPPSPLFGQPSSTPSTPSQQFGFQKPSSGAILPSFPAVPGESDEEGMEEEAPSTISSEFGGFGGFRGLGLGTSPISTEGKSNPFGVESPSLSPNLGFGMSSPGGQLFRPASFSLPAAAQSSPPQSTGNPFGGSSMSMPSGSVFGQSGLGSGSTAGGGFGSATSFGHVAKVGQGQQALGSALGAFGQTRQLGSGFGATGFGPATSSGGFASAPSGGGFASAATGGGFASVASGGGFAGLAQGGGFANASPGGSFANASPGGGFANVSPGGGFANASPGGGFAGASGGGSFGNTSPSGGFQSFTPNQGSTAFGGFGGSPGFGPASQAPLFTQMRK